MITLLFGTETLGQRFQKEGYLNLYSIESVDNDADELKIKFWAHWNNNINWAAQKDFIQTCHLSVFKVTQKVPSFPSMSIFISAGNHFAWKQEGKCPNTRKELCSTITFYGFRQNAKTN